MKKAVTRALSVFMFECLGEPKPQKTQGFILDKLPV